MRAAIGRLLPGAEVIRQEPRSREVADFVILYRENELFVETKWRSDPAREFGGSTLQLLATQMPSEARLLVVVNIPPMPRAYATISNAMGERGKIVMWQTISDDPALGGALTSLLNAATEPAPQPDRPGT